LSRLIPGPKFCTFSLPRMPRVVSSLVTWCG
jgi:hypothetical protein